MYILLYNYYLLCIIRYSLLLIKKSNNTKVEIKVEINTKSFLILY